MWQVPNVDNNRRSEEWLFVGRGLPSSWKWSVTGGAQVHGVDCLWHSEQRLNCGWQNFKGNCG